MLFEEDSAAKVPWSDHDESVQQPVGSRDAPAVHQPEGTNEWLGLLDSGDEGAEAALEFQPGMMDMYAPVGKEQTVTPPDNGVAHYPSSAVGRAGLDDILLSEQTIGEDEGWEPDGGGGGSDGAAGSWQQEEEWRLEEEPEPSFQPAPTRVGHAQVQPRRETGVGGFAQNVGSPRELTSPRGGISKRAKPVSLRALAKAKRAADPSLMMSSMVDTPFRTMSDSSDMAAPAVGADRWSMTQSEDWGQNRHFQGSASTFGDTSSMMITGMIFEDELARPAAATPTSHASSDAVLKRGNAGGGVEIEEAVMEPPPPPVHPRGGDASISPPDESLSLLEGLGDDLLGDDIPDREPTQPIKREPSPAVRRPVRNRPAARAAAGGKPLEAVPPLNQTLTKEGVLRAAELRTL